MGMFLVRCLVLTLVLISPLAPAEVAIVLNSGEGTVSVVDKAR